MSNESGAVHCSALKRYFWTFLTLYGEKASISIDMKQLANI